MPIKRPFIIQYRGCCGNAALWWRPNRSGYTTSIDEAGRYTEVEARSIEAVRGLDKAWLAEQIEPLSTRTIDVDRLPPESGAEHG